MKAYVFSNLATGQYTPAVSDSTGKLCPAPFTTFDEERAHAYAEELATLNPHDDINNVRFPACPPRLNRNIETELAVIREQLALLKYKNDRLAELKIDTGRIVERLQEIVHDNYAAILEECKHDTALNEALRPLLADGLEESPSLILEQHP